MKQLEEDQQAQILQLRLPSQEGMQRRFLEQIQRNTALSDLGTNPLMLNLMIRRKGNIRNGDPSINSRRAGIFVLRPWNCMWVRNVMNEFLKIGPVSIGLLVDTQQLQSGITGACSFSLGVRI